MRRVSRLLACAGVVAVLGGATTIPTGPDPKSAGWEELIFEKLPPNRWTGDGEALVVESQGSISILHYTVAVNPQTTPVLSFRWRVDAGPPPTDLSQKGGDDRALAVTLGFAYDSAQASFGERLKRTLVEAYAGSNAPGRTIDLNFGGTNTPGQFYQDPYTGDAGKQITLRDASAEIGVWLNERVDIAQLYRDAFGQEPTTLTQVAVTMDTDDTKVRGVARVADFNFASQ